MSSRKVVCLIRVSTEEQELEKQEYSVEMILREHNLEQLALIQLKVSGTVVEKTKEYREAMVLLQRPDVIGLVVPSIDRWFRFKLLSEIGDYIKPFEQLLNDGQVNKLIFCNLGAWDVRNREHQDKILDAIRFASKERETINTRFTEGKDLGRRDPQVKIDKLPAFVEFVPFEEEGKKKKVKTRQKGHFVYNDFARDSVKPLCERFLAGEPIYQLHRELGFVTLMHARHCLRNMWLLGIKHRSKHSEKIWDEEKNRFRSINRAAHETPIEVPTNLAANPLISKEMFDAIQDKMAVRKVEYGNRKKIIDEFLASPLLHCKCGARMYGRRGSKGRPDTYTCATRYRMSDKRTEKCNEPIFKRAELDRQVGIRLFYLLTNNEVLNKKIDEALNEDHQAEAQAVVAFKERVVSDLEKKASRIRKHMQDSDDDKLPIDLNKINRELAAARNAVVMAKENVSEIPEIDRPALRRQAHKDALAFRKNPHAEQKAILMKYVKRITAQADDTTDYESYAVDTKPDGNPILRALTATEQAERVRLDARESGHRILVTLDFKIDLPIMRTVGQVGTRTTNEPRTKRETTFSACLMRFCCGGFQSATRKNWFGWRNRCRNTQVRAVSRTPITRH